MNHISQIINFYNIIEKLCLINRDNYLSKGGFESDADHIFKLSFLVMMVHPYLKKKADYTKMLELALVHDIVEAQSGDVSLSAQTKEIKAQKKQKEMDAIEYYKSILPSPLNEKIYDLFIEYEQRETIEAKLIWCLDKLDALSQANLYKDGNICYWSECENGQWYYQYAITKKELIKELDEDILTDLEDALIKKTEENIKKHNIKVCA